MKSKLNLTLSRKIENNEELKEKMENLKEAVMIKNKTLLFFKLTHLNFIAIACSIAIMTFSLANIDVYRPFGNYFMVSFLFGIFISIDLFFKFQNFYNFLQLRDLVFKNTMDSIQEIEVFFYNLTNIKFAIKNKTLLHVPMKKKIISAIEDATRVYRKIRRQPLNEEEMKELNELLSFRDDESRENIFKKHLKMIDETWQISYESAFSIIGTAEENILEIEKAKMAKKLTFKKEY